MAIRGQTSTKPNVAKRATNKTVSTAVAKATSTEANRTVLLAVGGGIGVILIARMAGTPGVKGLNDPGDLLKVAVGGSATIIGLMVIAEFAPQISIGMAWLIFVGAVLTYGVEFARALSKGTLNPGIPLSSQVGQKAGK